MDFVNEVRQTIDKTVADKMPAMIEKSVEKMIEDIVKDVFSWGDTKKHVKEKIEQALSVNLKEFDLIDYSSLVAKVINDNLMQQVNLQPIIDMTKDIVGLVNQKEIKLSEIAGLMTNAAMEENDKDSEGEITFISEVDSVHEWVSVYADLEPGKSEHECSIKFIFSTKGALEGKIFSFRTKDYYHAEARPVTTVRMISMRGIEAKIFRLYSAQVKIIANTKDVETYWSKY